MGDGSRAAAADNLCATTIVEDLKLEGNVSCSGDGLTVGADGIRIDLNGFSLSGSGTSVGIAVTGRHDMTIAGGRTGNFAAAIRVISSTDIEIKHIEFLGNPEGIDFQAGSVANTVKENVFRDSTTRGIMLRSNTSENDIKNNTFINDRVGILVFGGVDNTIKQNEVTGSILAGIRLNVIATGNVLKDNTVSSSLAGIEFLVTPTGSAQGNELKGNTLSANGCGLKGPTAENTLKDNVFDGNTADTCS
jgi:parallel beta-helix repeat protein